MLVANITSRVILHVICFFNSVLYIFYTYSLTQSNILES